jgi:hypothetical protein
MGLGCPGEPASPLSAKILPIPSAMEDRDEVCWCQNMRKGKDPEIMACS